MIWRALILIALLAASPVGAESWLPPRADLAAMPASGNVSGDARLSLADGQVYYWTGSAWSALASGSGTVSSVALAAPSLFTISGSPVTTTGTLTLALATQSANTVFAGPTTGSAAAPTMRALVAADLPAATTSNRGGVVLSTDGEATAGEAVQATDARLTDARTPSAHASSHAAAGGDPVTLAQSQVTNLASDLAGKAAASHAHAAGDITSGQLGVANGGTGVASLTAYAPVCGGTTSTGAVQSCGTGQSNPGYVYTSNGGSALPSWQAAAGGVSDPLTIGTVITTTSLEPRGQTSGGQAASHVQIGSGASANGSNADYGAIAIGKGATAGGSTTYGSIAIGAGSTATSSQGTCVGLLCSVTSSGVAMGTVATAGGGGVAIGPNVTAAGSLAISVGDEAAAASGSHGIRIGRGGDAGHKAAIAIGIFASSTADRQLVIGGESGGGWSTTSAYIGGGVTEADPDGLLLTTSGGSGSNVVGGDFTVAGGKGTGNAAGGAVILSTSDAGASGAALQTLTEKARIPTDGGVRIADPGTRPTCDSAHRGTIWYDAGGAGVADTFAVCGKSAADTYSWVAAATF